MKVCTLFLAIMFSVAATAQDIVQQDHPAVNRYQLIPIDRGLYLIDTATGKLWFQRFGSGDRWEVVKTPIGALAEKPVTADAKPAQLTLPRKGIVMPMIQRETREIPGADGTLRLHVGDITGGQVFVEIKDQKGVALLERTSLRRGQSAKFKVEDRNVVISVRQMVNNLVGEDICTLHLSHARPDKSSEAPASDESTAETEESGS